MQTKIVMLASGERAEDAYRRLVAVPKTCRIAAHVAQKYNLGRRLTVVAAYKAYCYYDKMAEKRPEFQELADGVLKEFKLSLATGSIIAHRDKFLIVFDKPIEELETGALIFTHNNQGMAN